MLTKEISHIQAKILKELLMDGRITAAEISERNGLRKEIVHKSIQEMKRSGIIKGATIHINYREFGYRAVAMLLINVEPAKADQLADYVKKMQDIYAVYSNGPKGNIRVVTTLKTFQQLDEVKDAIKLLFSTSNLRTVIWTDVKEMHQNLLLSHDKETAELEKATPDEKEEKTAETKKEKAKIDEIDHKIADILSKNGFAPIDKIAKEIGISTSNAKKRYEKLKKHGLLKVTVQIDPTKLGYRALAIFYLTFTLNQDSTSTIEKISRIPDIISIMKTSGDYDLQVYAMIRDIDELLAIQGEFAKIDGIAKTEMDISAILSEWPTPRQYISTF